MPRIKLTKKQNRRIHQNQQQICLDDNPENYLEGLVVAHYGDKVDIENISNNTINKIIRSNLRQNLPPIAVGDYVIYQLLNNESQTEELAVIIKLIERKSLLSRNHTNKNTIKPIAANIDQVFIVFAPEPEPSSLLIDQFLITAEMSKIKPILVFNKQDIYYAYYLNNNTDKLKIIDKLVSLYSTIGYQVLSTAINQTEQILKLKALMANKSSILVGQSGVGKSSLTKQILPNEEIKINAVSDKIKLGRHTTSVAKLFHLDNQGMLIDAPGVREIGISHLKRRELEQCYPEFLPFLNKCKFNDCHHEKEPDCAFKQALESGKINLERWLNYKKFCAICQDFRRLTL